MIIDKIRDKQEFLDLFRQRPIYNPNLTDEFLLNNPHTYCFYDDGLMGAIFITEEQGKLWLSGFSKPKIYKDVLDAIRIVCDSYKQDIYSRTTEKSAIFALLKSGFTKIETEIYKKEFKNG